MSCDSSTRLFCARAAAQLGAAFGGNAALAQQALEQVHELATARAAAQRAERGERTPARLDAARERAADARAEEATIAIFYEMQQLRPAIPVPAHGDADPRYGFPLPNRDAQRGWLAVHETLAAARHGRPLPDLAREVRDGMIRQAGKSAPMPLMARAYVEAAPEIVDVANDRARPVDAAARGTLDAAARALAPRAQGALAAADRASRAKRRDRAVATAALVTAATDVLPRENALRISAASYLDSKKRGGDEHAADTWSLAGALCAVGGVRRCSSCGRYQSLTTPHQCPPPPADDDLEDDWDDDEDEAPAEDQQPSSATPEAESRALAQAAIAAAPALIALANGELDLQNPMAMEQLDAATARLSAITQTAGQETPPALRDLWMAARVLRDVQTIPAHSPHDTFARRDLAAALCIAAGVDRCPTCEQFVSPTSPHACPSPTREPFDGAAVDAEDIGPVHAGLARNGVVLTAGPEGALRLRFRSPMSAAMRPYEAFEFDGRAYRLVGENVNGRMYEEGPLDSARSVPTPLFAEQLPTASANLVREFPNVIDVANDGGDFANSSAIRMYARAVAALEIPDDDPNHALFVGLREAAQRYLDAGAADASQFARLLAAYACVAGGARRCPACGRFQSAERAHECPLDWVRDSLPEMRAWAHAGFDELPDVDTLPQHTRDALRRLAEVLIGQPTRDATWYRVEDLRTQLDQLQLQDLDDDERQMRRTIARQALGALAIHLDTTVLSSTPLPAGQGPIDVDEARRQLAIIREERVNAAKALRLGELAPRLPAAVMAEALDAVETFDLAFGWYRGAGLGELVKVLPLDLMPRARALLTTIDARRDLGDEGHRVLCTRIAQIIEERTRALDRERLSAALEQALPGTGWAVISATHSHPGAKMPPWAAQGQPTPLEFAVQELNAGRARARRWVDDLAALVPRAHAAETWRMLRAARPDDPEAARAALRHALPALAWDAWANGDLAQGLPEWLAETGDAMIALGTEIRRRPPTDRALAAVDAAAASIPAEDPPHITRTATAWQALRAALRCPNCGQWLGQPAHDCPFPSTPDTPPDGGQTTPPLNGGARQDTGSQNENSAAAPAPTIGDRLEAAQATLHRDATDRTAVVSLLNAVEAAPTEEAGQALAQIAAFLTADELERARDLLERLPQGPTQIAADVALDARGAVLTAQARTPEERAAAIREAALHVLDNDPQILASANGTRRTGVPRSSTYRGWVGLIKAAALDAELNDAYNGWSFDDHVAEQRLARLVCERAGYLHCEQCGRYRSPTAGHICRVSSHPLDVALRDLPDTDGNAVQQRLHAFYTVIPTLRPDRDTADIIRVARAFPPAVASVALANIAVATVQVSRDTALITPFLDATLDVARQALDGMDPWPPTDENSQAVHDPYRVASALAGIVTLLDDARRARARELAGALPDPYWRAEAMRAVAPRDLAEDLTFSGRPGGASAGRRTR